MISGVGLASAAGDAGDALAKIKTALGLTVAETGLLADAMNHLSNAQASSASDILDFFRRSGADGKMFGFAADQTAAFGSAMISSGAQSDVAATSFRNMGRALTKGASATRGQRAAYKALGLEAVTTAKRMQKDAVGTTLDVLERINKLPKHMQASIASALFGDEARALMPLITNLALLRESLGLVAQQTRYAGSAAREYEVRSKTFANSVQLFKNRFEELKIALGNLMMPGLSRFMDGFGAMFGDVADALDDVDNRVGVFDTLNAKLQGLAKGLGFDGMADLRSGLGGLLTAVIGDPKTFSADIDAMGAGFEQFRQFGTSLRDFAAGVKSVIDPMLQFMGIDWATIGTYGVTVAGAAIGFAAFAKTIRLLAGALYFLSGARAGVAVLRALGIIGGAAVVGTSGGGIIAAVTGLATAIGKLAPMLRLLGTVAAAYGGWEIGSAAGQKLNEVLASPIKAWTPQDAEEAAALKARRDDLDRQLREIQAKQAPNMAGMPNPVRDQLLVDRQAAQSRLDSMPSDLKEIAGIAGEAKTSLAAINAMQIAPPANTAWSFDGRMNVAYAGYFGISYPDGSGFLIPDTAGEANARLIAAAPDMKAELRRDLVFVREIKRLLIATKQRGTVQFTSAEMREAALLKIIAKADGRS